MKMNNSKKLETLYNLCELGLNPNTILDVGVLRGTEELKEVFKDKKHILIEPIKSLEKEIKENYKDIDYDYIPKAASNKIGTSSIRIISKYKKIKGSQISDKTIIKQNHKKKIIKEEIETITIDSLTSSGKYEKPYLLKIDVDGVELEVLEGSIVTLKNTDCVILEATVNPNGYTNFFEKGYFVESCGFKLINICDTGYNEKNFIYQTDLIFISDKLYKKINDI